MTDEIDERAQAEQAAMFREITTNIAQKCMAKGFETPFSIDITDASGFWFSGLYMPDDERGGIKLHAVKVPEDEHGKIPVRDLLFPLKIHASDHRGREYDTEVHSRH